MLTQCQNKKQARKMLSINIVDEGILLQADYSGFESFICASNNTYVEEQHLNEDGKVNYHTLKPVLFEFPTYEYLKTGEVIGKCLSFKNGESI